MGLSLNSSYTQILPGGNKSKTQLLTRAHSLSVAGNTRERCNLAFLTLHHLKSTKRYLDIVDVNAFGPLGTLSASWGDGLPGKQMFVNFMST